MCLGLKRKATNSHNKNSTRVYNNLVDMEDLSRVETVLVRLVQKLAFGDELDILRTSDDKRSVRKTSSIYRLDVCR